MAEYPKHFTEPNYQMQQQQKFMISPMWRPKTATTDL